MKLKELLETISTSQDIVVFDSEHNPLIIDEKAILNSKKKYLLELEFYCNMEVKEISTNRDNIIFIYLMNKFNEETYEICKLYIIENTITAQNLFGHNYGSSWLQITQEQIKLLSIGKQLAFTDGEYSNFISLEEPKEGQ